MSNSKELIQFALNKIEKQIGHLRCPICGNDHKQSFIIEQRVYHFLSMTEADVVKEGQMGSVKLKTPLNVIRTISVTCKKCGYMLLFNHEMVQSFE